MRKILIPTDFSDNAMNAVKYALELFKYDISKFYIMHAYQDEIYNDESLLHREKLDSVTKTVHNNSVEKLENILKQVKKISPNPRHEYHIISSNSILVDETDRIVDKENIDIIVMGTKGETNDRHVSFGSHTLQVLKYVQCPVLAIPENYKYVQPQNILFPTNYIIPNKRRELKLICEMAYSFKAMIDMVYISTSNKLSMRQEDNKMFIKNELCKNQINFTFIKQKDVKNTILNYLKSKKVDMLVMVNTRQSFLEDILFESTVSKISLHIEIPFLVLQNIKRI
ncbi:universal stress protein [Bizionia arctica]|uniref:Universal stress protein n=1 Tax=Bizionia arctica TaxID=1495645 RepID=A0A917GAB1_9FLAO|nr:universal stress protein [Bizionia arctica]GGG33383.1 universal stress protein [Bizionia arctica]